MLDQEYIAYFNANDGTAYLALGCQSIFKAHANFEWSELDAFFETHRGRFIVTSFSYELKQATASLPSTKQNPIDYPLIQCWVPEVCYRINGNDVRIFDGHATPLLQQLQLDFLKALSSENETKLSGIVHRGISKENYLRTVQKLKSHLQRGDIYEVNFCQEFRIQNLEINNPIGVYASLNAATKAPFSVYLQSPSHFVFCASPERFLKKTGQRLIAEPIKGTAARHPDKLTDDAIAAKLQADPKERAENIMIVDLMRNDLARIAKKNSVEVEELCGLYHFETVHQLISRISCQLAPETSYSQLLKALFPMGSMTGAPKLAAMQLIDAYETFSRGLYSGSIGYCLPTGDFDWNVVIRSLLYNREKQLLSLAAGSAITMLSANEAEYEECLLKINRILNGLQLH
ncbi:MAG: hypothetical protein RLZZ301_1116 [Bacteroidota bacterium]